MPAPPSDPSDGPEVTVRLRRAADRFVTRLPGVETRHCFSFGAHYDPAHVAHGRLVVCDDHRLDPGSGFAPHPHRDVEVVSWVLEGTLLHGGDAGESVVPAGGLQRMVAGSGVVHSERAGAQATRFLQLWRTVPPGLAPSYEQVPPPRAPGLVEALPGVHVGRLAAGEAADLPDAMYVHVFVAQGGVELDGRVLAAGDSARLTAAGALRVRAAAAGRLLVVSQE